MYTPLPKQCGAEQGDEMEKAGIAKLYRSLVATVNYLAVERPDLQQAASVLGRTASLLAARNG